MARLQVYSGDSLSIYKARSFGLSSTVTWVYRLKHGARLPWKKRQKKHMKTLLETLVCCLAGLALGALMSGLL